MNDTGGLRRLCALADSPLSDFVGTACKEAAKVQGITHGDNDLWQGRLGSQLLALFLDLSVGFKLSQSFLKTDGKRDNGIASCMGLNPFCNFRQVLVLLANVVLLAQIDQIDNGLGSQKEQRIDHLDLIKLLISMTCHPQNDQVCNNSEFAKQHIQTGILSQDSLNVRLNEVFDELGYIRAIALIHHNSFDDA